MKPAQNLTNLSIKELRQIIDTVKEFRGFDFSNYAFSSFQRRIVRILSVYKIDGVSNLCDKIKNDDHFYDLFLKEVTVNTTEMFRDPSMWKSLRKLLITLFQDKESIKIWHAGCSSGEEVYSMCILLKETGLYHKTKLVATDINTEVIENARKGHYALRNLEINESNYKEHGGAYSLNKYSNTSGATVQMDQSLINNVEFKVHNLVMDKAFDKFDLILCRNVMIYFDQILQENVFKLFHASLKQHAYFVIGAKESMIWCSINNKFKLVDSKEKIYQKVM